jgi:hypothetical protein
VEASDDKRAHQRKLALACAENFIATWRAPFVVLDRSLRLKRANDVARAHACLARCLPRLIRIGSGRPVVFSITPTIG